MITTVWTIGITQCFIEAQTVSNYSHKAEQKQPSPP